MAGWLKTYCGSSRCIMCTHTQTSNYPSNTATFWIFDPRLWDRHVVRKRRYEIITTCCEITQKSAVLTAIVDSKSKCSCMFRPRNTPRNLPGFYLRGVWNFWICIFFSFCLISVCLFKYIVIDTTQQLLIPEKKWQVTNWCLHKTCNIYSFWT